MPPRPSSQRTKKKGQEKGEAQNLSTRSLLPPSSIDIRHQPHLLRTAGPHDRSHATDLRVSRSIHHRRLDLPRWSPNLQAGRALLGLQAFQRRSFGLPWPPGGDHSASLDLPRPPSKASSSSFGHPQPPCGDHSTTLSLQARPSPAPSATLSFPQPPSKATSGSFGLSQPPGGDHSASLGLQARPPLAPSATLGLPAEIIQPSSTSLGLQARLPPAPSATPGLPRTPIKATSVSFSHPRPPSASEQGHLWLLRSPPAPLATPGLPRSLSKITRPS